MNCSFVIHAFFECFRIPEVLFFYQLPYGITEQFSMLNYLIFGFTSFRWFSIFGRSYINSDLAYTTNLGLN